MRLHKGEIVSPYEVSECSLDLLDLFQFEQLTTVTTVSTLKEWHLSLRTRKQEPITSIVK